jgi:hypothetical protein
MMPLVDGQPRAGETWDELAEHAITHYDLPLHWHLASGDAVAAHVRAVPALRTTTANPLRLRTVPCTGTVICAGPHAGRCESHAGRLGWHPKVAASLPESRNAVD